MYTLPEIVDKIIRPSPCDAAQYCYAVHCIKNDLRRRILMTNRARIACTPLNDLIKSISQHTDACTIKIMTGKFPAQFRCGKYVRCDACLTAWLDEEEESKNENQ